jgi:hypothetical protein
MSAPQAAQTLRVVQTAGYIHTPEDRRYVRPVSVATGCLQT